MCISNSTDCGKSVHYEKNGTEHRLISCFLKIIYLSALGKNLMFTCLLLSLLLFKPWITYLLFQVLKILLPLAWSFQQIFMLVHTLKSEIKTKFYCVSLVRIVNMKVHHIVARRPCVHRGSSIEFMNGVSTMSCNIRKMIDILSSIFIF